MIFLLVLSLSPRNAIAVLLNVLLFQLSLSPSSEFFSTAQYHMNMTYYERTFLLLLRIIRVGLWKVKSRKLQNWKKVFG